MAQRSQQSLIRFSGLTLSSRVNSNVSKSDTFNLIVTTSECATSGVQECADTQSTVLLAKLTLALAVTGMTLAFLPELVLWYLCAAVDKQQSVLFRQVELCWGGGGVNRPRPFNAEKLLAVHQAPLSQ